MEAVSGEIFWGRTMDLAAGMFGEDAENAMPSSIINVPKNIEMKSALKSWTSKYAAIGVGGTDTIALYDGVNEKGLAGDIQVLMECTRASNEAIEARHQIPVIGEEFVTYILTQYASVEAIRADYTKFALSDQPFIKGLDLQIPAHYTFVDPTGDSVVLEPVNDGAFKMYDNVGVVTNSPEYNWHTTNLRNYIGLNRMNVTTDKPMNAHLTLKPIEAGTGYGLFGLPGDFTSVSRFTRAAVVANYMDDFAKEEGINQLYAAFRSVIIPRGLEHADANSPLTDYTRYWAGYDLSQRKLYVQSGNGLAVSEKTIDETLTAMTYTPVDTGNNVHVL